MLRHPNNDLVSFQNGVDTIVSGCTTYGSTPSSNTPSNIVNAIKAIYNNRYNAGVTATKKGTAVASNVLSGKTFTNASSVGISGTMTNNGAISKTITPSASTQSYTIPKGYHNGSGKITVTPFKNEDLFDKILGIAFFTLGYNSSTDGYEYGWNKVGNITASGTFSNARYTITIGPGKYLKYININNSTKDPEIITLTANTKYSSVVYAVFIKISR